MKKERRGEDVALKLRYRENLQQVKRIVLREKRKKYYPGKQKLLQILTMPLPYSLLDRLKSVDGSLGYLNDKLLIYDGEQLKRWRKRLVDEMTDMHYSSKQKNHLNHWN